MGPGGPARGRGEGGFWAGAALTHPHPSSSCNQHPLWALCGGPFPGSWSQEFQAHPGFTGSLLGYVAEAGAKDISGAVEAAHQAAPGKLEGEAGCIA